MISKVKIAATALGAFALIGVWQAGSYNQAKQEKWNKAVPQVSENANQMIQPHPVVENQTEQMPKPIEIPTAVTQEPLTPAVVPAVNIPSTDAGSYAASDSEKKQHEDGHQDHKKEKERD